MTNNSSSRKRRLERLHEELKDKLRSLVRTFHRKYGGDISELVAEANLHFIDIISEYGDRDKNRGLKLITKVQRGVWWKLLKTKKAWVQRNNILHQKQLPRNVQIQGGSSFDLLDFLVTLSDSAKFIVQCVVHPPVQLEKMLDKIKTPTGKDVRMALKIFLATVGWSPEKIVRVFKEVRISLVSYQEE